MLILLLPLHTRYIFVSAFVSFTSARRRPCAAHLHPSLWRVRQNGQSESFASLLARRSPVSSTSFECRSLQSVQSRASPLLPNADTPPVQARRAEAADLTSSPTHHSGFLSPPHAAASALGMPWRLHCFHSPAGSSCAATPGFTCTTRTTGPASCLRPVRAACGAWGSRRELLRPPTLHAS